MFNQEFFNHYELNSVSDEIQKYHLLWKSVISQAIADATSNGKKTESIVAKRKAISWLSDHNQDFVYVCILANYDSVYAHNKILPALP
ncbi:MAG: hypothetical protein QWI36_04115 [Wolbachia endosymbiont of Tyrophagus putrescentiae]|nr:hypothetical protein [Wolbachia endosymbiont of Tyrophagus putrescentiae]